MSSTETIPPFVSYVTQTLQEAGFEAYLVGGCVRDRLMGKTPKDWDIATNARPEQVQEVFASYKTVYENDFGTVTVINIATNAEDRVTYETPLSHEASAKLEDLNNQVQVTTYRSEGNYGDNRHPDSVTYETELSKDLERRDFTMNAIAWDPIKDILFDPYKGQDDIKDKVVRCVLNPSTRFEEDALRMMRA